jgi:UDP-glucose 4-epimerase
MNQALKGEPMSVFGDGEQQRAFSDITDVAPVIAESIQFPTARNQVFNVGADTPFTVNKLAQTIARSMGVELKIRYLEARNEVKIAYSDHTKSKSVFGQRNPTALHDGINAMAAWVKIHGARESNIFSNIEIAKKLPQSWAQAMSKLH